MILTFTGLCGTSPQPHDNGSTAGLTHEWHAKTPYYSARVPIWIDEIADIEAWTAEFLKPEAEEVVKAVGAWVYCFTGPIEGDAETDVEKTLKAMQEVSALHAGYGAEMAMLAVAMPVGQTTIALGDDERERLDDMCIQYGFELVDYPAHGKNEYGEKLGLERLREALEANEWADTADSDDGQLDLENEQFGLGDDDDDNLSGFARDEAEMTAELFGMKAALGGSDFEPDADDIWTPQSQESQVEDLDRMMSKLLAVKEQSADLPEQERKRLAAKAVRELLNDHPAP